VKTMSIVLIRLRRTTKSFVIGLFLSSACVGAVQAQMLGLEKTADPLTYDERGDFIIYHYIVTNNGAASVAGPIAISDDKTTVSCPDLSTSGNGDGELQPGDSLVCTATYFTTLADVDNGSLTNSAQASASGELSNQASVTTLACRGEASPLPTAPTVEFLRSYRAFFNAPTRLAVDSDNKVYITDPVNGRLVVRHTDGRIAFELNELEYPVSVAADGFGNVYVGEGKSGRVDVFASDGSFSHSLGQGNTEFQMPADIAINPLDNDIYVTDSDAGIVKHYASNGSLLQTFGSEIGMKVPTGIAVNSVKNEVLVVDQRTSRIHVFNTEGDFQFCIGSKVLTGGFFCDGFLCGKDRQFDQGIWVDNQERIFIADTFEGAVYVMGRDGVVVSRISAFGQHGGQLRTPTDLVVDGFGRLYVAAANNARVEMFGLDIYSDPETFVPGKLEIETDPLDRDANSDVVGFMELPGQRLNEIIPSSILANGIATPKSTLLGDFDNDTIPDLRLTFGPELGMTLPTGSATVTVTGQVNEFGFELSDDVQVASGDLDADSDGVPDVSDLCPTTIPGDIVAPDGCSIDQNCPCTGPALGHSWITHGEYVSCVTHAAKSLFDLGLISGRQRGQTASTAAASDCGGVE